MLSSVGDGDKDYRPEVVFIRTIWAIKRQSQGLLRLHEAGHSIGCGQKDEPNRLFAFNEAVRVSQIYQTPVHNS